MKIEPFMFALLICISTFLLVVTVYQAAIIGIYDQMIIVCEVPRQIDKCYIIAQPE